ncbi:ATP-dependent DNA helicase sgs1 [Marasmius crinis-equi]|uniref:ATP-dependent DNA helicase sgs1 n=1 Tax=Marasmius crinis-equi TaxID=585013 RepID=A0ABR3FSK3_9AGAR
MPKTPELSRYSPLPPHLTVRKRKKTQPHPTPSAASQSSTKPINISDSEPEGDDRDSPSTSKKSRTQNSISNPPLKGAESKAQSGSVTTIPCIPIVASSSRSAPPSSLQGADAQARLAFNHTEKSHLNVKLATYYTEVDYYTDIHTLHRIENYTSNRADICKAELQSLPIAKVKIPVNPAPISKPQPKRVEITEKSIEERLAAVFDVRKWEKVVIVTLHAFLKGKDIVFITRSPSELGLYRLLAGIGKLNGNTGTTVIVSPFIQPSDISLLKGKSIGVEHWKDSHSLISKPLDVIYVNPSAICSNEASLRKLFTQRMVSRMLVDTTWCSAGFYKTVANLRRDNPDIPFLLLSPNGMQSSIDRTVDDLGLQEYTFYRQSRNPGNLRFTVSRRTSSVVQEIVDFIRTDHREHRGLVFCQDRAAGEAIVLQAGSSTKWIHDGTGVQEKSSILAAWRSGKCRVLVLMNCLDFSDIYAPDSEPLCLPLGACITRTDHTARFIIHREPPASLDIYYRHTCLAGGDGAPADLVLYYTCSDLKGINSKATGVNSMASYCRNESLCRRTELLPALGESFSKKCGDFCDICKNNEQFFDQEVTEEARRAIKLIQQLGSRGMSLRYCQEVFAGHRTAQVRKNKDTALEQFGGGARLLFDCIEQLFEELYLLDIWKHRGVATDDWDSSIVEPGPTATRVLETPGFSLVLKTRDISQPEPLRDPSTPPSTLPLWREDTSSAGSSFKDEADLLNKIDVEVDDDHERSMRVLALMTELRQKIQKESGVRTPEDILDDQTLQLLSLAPPHDYRGFKSILKECSGFSSPQEQENFASKKWNDFGQPFLNICIRGQPSSSSSGERIDDSWRRLLLTSDPADVKPRGRLLANAGYEYSGNKPTVLKEISRFKFGQ